MTEPTPPRSTGVFTRLADQRASLVGVIVTVVVLALAVNLLSDAIADGVGVRSSGIVGAVVLLILGLYAVTRLRTTSTHKYEAFLVGNSNGALQWIPRYEFAEAARHLVDIGMAASPAVTEAWRDEREQVLQEVTEFFVLNQLATHLDRYATEIDPRSTAFKPLAREDLAELGSSNRILQVLADPEKLPIEMGDVDGTLVSLVLPGDTVIRRYALNLPLGSSVGRDADGVVTASTKSVQIRFSTEPMKAFLAPLGFLEKYVGCDPRQATMFSTGVKVNVRVRFRAILEGRGLRYSRWVDSFLVELEKRLDIHHFLRRIGWEQAHTVLATGTPEGSRPFPSSTTDRRPIVERLVEIMRDAGLTVGISEDRALLQISRGSSVIQGLLRDIDGELVFHLSAPLVVEIDDGGGRAPEILDTLNTLSLRVPLVRFAYEADRKEVLLIHDLLLSSLQPEQAGLVASQVSSIADWADDEIRQSLGSGRLIGEMIEESRDSAAGTGTGAD